jgi:hypothetical protein
MELAVLVGGAAEMAHHFRPHGALRRNDKADVVLQGLFEKKAAGLSVFLGEIGKLPIEARIHLQTYFFVSVLATCLFL